MPLFCRALALRLSFVPLLSLGSAFAGVVDVPPNDIQPWIRHHPQAVVFYQSFDKDCAECTGADLPFYTLAGKFDGKPSFARVTWKAWNLIPTGVKDAFGHDSPPGVVAYQDGRKLMDFQGNIRNVDELAKKLRTAYSLDLPTKLWSPAANQQFAQSALKWDLSYRGALRDFRVAPNEIIRRWQEMYPRRPILDYVSRYTGAPITGSMLIDMPDSHAGDPAAVWLIQTRHYAMVCHWDKRTNAFCKSVDHTYAGNVIHELMQSQVPVPVAEENKVAFKDPKGAPILLNYVGFVSFYDHGKALQRPIAMSELEVNPRAGYASGEESDRLALALGKLAMSPEDRRAALDVQDPRQARVNEQPRAREQDALPVPKLTVGPSELSVQHKVAAATQTYLYSQNYKALEALYIQLNAAEGRSPSGLWMLEVYFNTVKSFVHGGVDPEHWQAMQERAKDWQRQIPGSVAAQIFEAYVHFEHAIVQRGFAPAKAVNPNDLWYMSVWARQGIDALQKVEGQAAAHPEWHRAMISLLPYADKSASDVDRVVRKGMRVQAGYAPMFFEASYYLLPKWGGSNAMIDRLARDASAASSGTEGRAMYARIYWSLDNTEFHGTLFKASHASWPDMKNGFVDIVARYPDPYNLNAFAYYACLAGDYATVDDLLNRIASDLILEKWGERGQENYERCHRHEAIG